MANDNDKSGPGEPPSGDARFQGSLSEIIASFQNAGVTQGQENSAAPTNETNSSGGNTDGGEMGHGRIIPTEQGTPGRFNTMVGGQEEKLSDPPQKEPASNVAPDTKAQAETTGQDMKTNESSAGNLSSKIAEAGGETHSGATKGEANTAGNAADAKAPDAANTKNAVDPTIAAGAVLTKSGTTSNGVSTEGNLSNLVADARDKGQGNAGQTNTPSNDGSRSH